MEVHMKNKRTQTYYFLLFPRLFFKLFFFFTLSKLLRMTGTLIHLSLINAWSFSPEVFINSVTFDLSSVITLICISAVWRMWGTPLPPNKHDYYSCARGSEGNSLMTTARNVFRRCRAPLGFESLISAEQMTPVWLLHVPVLPCNFFFNIYIKNDFGSRISWT